MGLELKRSSLQESSVRKMVEKRYEAFKTLSGRNPSESQRKEMRDQVIGLAKRIDKDRGTK